MSGKLFNVAKIVNTVGIRGELKLLTQTDFPDVRFREGNTLLVIDPTGKVEKVMTVQTSRPHKNIWAVKFKEIPDIDAAEKYKGWSIKVREEHLLKLEEHEFYHHEIIGCLVVTDEGEELGTISEILTPGANDVWVVEREKAKPLLIPYIADVVLDVNVQEKRVTVQLLEGLL
ncbi:MAG: ribosome maturation factor RimM [Gorillibacterium sp.]|nr:ribosome maturation factor RimM [Gorillibacterium sp.]